MKEIDGFITPDLDGKVFKQGNLWKTSTQLPTIRFAKILQPPDFLLPGMHIRYDLLTKIGVENNIHIATNVQRFEKNETQKLKPKQRDKLKRRKI